MRLVRSGRHQDGCQRGGPAGLAAPFAGLVLSAKEPVQGADRPQVGAFSEEGVPDLGGGLVTEPFAVERLEDGGGLGRLKSPVGSGPRFGWAEQRWASVAVVGGTAESEGGAAGAPAKHWGQLIDAGVEDPVT